MWKGFNLGEWFFLFFRLFPLVRVFDDCLGFFFNLGFAILLGFNFRLGLNLFVVLDAEACRWCSNDSSPMSRTSCEPR